MTDEQAFLQAIQNDPADPARVLVFADWLEERGDPRGELLRLTHILSQTITIPDRDRLEERLRALLAAGVQPVWPTCTNSIGMKLVLIPPGRFLMGSPPDEEGRHEDEDQHEVELTRAFWMGIFEVTQEQYETVMKSNPSWFSPTGHGRVPVQSMDSRCFPVESVSWNDAVHFCATLSELSAEKQAGRVYRLLTEAEWEYACRAGTTTPFHTGAALSMAQANFDDYSPHDDRGGLGRPTPVASFLPNAFGLSDLHGNVWEWCADWYAEDFYQSAPKENPENTTETQARVLRGGSCSHYDCRAAERNGDTPVAQSGDFGFRVAAVWSPR